MKEGDQVIIILIYYHIIKLIFICMVKEILGTRQNKTVASFSEILFLLLDNQSLVIQ